MKFLVVGGAGTCGSVAVRDLVGSPGVDEVIIADADAKRAAEVARRVGGPVRVEILDALQERGKLLELARRADVVVNAAVYTINIAVMRVALEAGRDYVDLGGAFYGTLEQLELDEEFKRVGRRAILGAGVAPGLADVLAKLGASRLDRADEVHIRYGERNLEKVKYKWSLRVTLDEFTKPVAIYEDGEFKYVDPLEGAEEYEFPEPVGRLPGCYSLYSGVATLPRTIPGLRRVDCRYYFSHFDRLITMVRVLEELNLTREEPVEVEGARISPKEFVVRVAPPPDASARDVVALVVEVVGLKEGSRARAVYTTVHAFVEEWEASALAYLTGVPLSVVAQMLARGEVSGYGVLPVEAAVEPLPFLAELRKRGIKVEERIEVMREL